MTEKNIAQWLDSLGLSRYTELFADNEIDWEVLPELTDTDLEKLGIPLGSRKKLLKGIANLGTAHTAPGSTDSAGDVGATTGAVQPAGAAERRQMTVVFCDLVGSSDLAAQLDPEDMGVILRDYRECVVNIVRMWEGHIAKYLGDGVLIYFGYPKAHEDDAERAVRASIELTAAVANLAPTRGGPLAARVGVATGLVMVGDLIGEEEAQERTVVGETPNLAARLQALAGPGQVVVAPNTRGLIGALFELTDLGPRKLKGFPAPVSAWQVRGTSQVASRFEALHGHGLTPLVGRAHEIGLLLDRFELARSGEGQVVLLSGEAGIGKSRIAQALYEHLADESHTRVRYFCSPYYTNSALQPIVDQLKRAAGFGDDDSDDANLDRLEALLSRAGEQSAEVAPLLAALCSIPADHRYPSLNLTPQAQKERTFDALLAQLTGLARQQPVVITLEDVHWLDPTSIELFGAMINQLQNLPVLLLITFRPEFAPPWTGYAYVTALTLSRLGQRQGAAIIERLAGGKTLPTEVLDQILKKTDGVPLFIEELTKTVLQSDLLKEGEDHYELSGPLPPFAIPTTLHDSLMARLDSLAPVKEVAQIGAVIGRSFEYELIDIISPMPEDQLRSALEQLVESELVFCRGNPPHATYSFKHALVQDAAYHSLLKSRRRQLHARIAQVLEKRFAGAPRSQPELLAHHCTEAGLIDKAIQQWRLAGEQAARRAAALEAVQHFQKALSLLESQTPGRERDVEELRVLIQFGPALMLVQGWASAEVGAMYRRARELARRLEDPAQLVPPLVGLWLYYQGSAQFDAADETTSELFEVAQSLDDADLLLQSHHAAWPIPMLRGVFTPAYQHIEQGLSLYDYERHSQHAFVYMGHDPGVCAHALGAVVSWNLGHIGRADRHAANALDLAQRLKHPPSLALALWFIAVAYAARGDSASARVTAEELLKISEEQKLIQTSASAQVIGGWALAQQGQAQEGTRQLEAGLKIWHRMGARHYLPAYTCLFAECFLSAGRYDQALEHVRHALSYCEETGERCWQARIHQTRGQILLHTKAPGPQSAEASFSAAIEIARKQGAKGLELRATTHLARLQRDRGSGRAAHDLLAPICNWFSEDIDTPDLKEANALLESTI